MSTIKITPQELRDASTYLGNRLETISAEVSSLKSKIDEVTQNWEGAAKSTFVETFENDMYPIMNETLPDVINGIASQLTGAADAIETADAEVANAFKG